MKNSKNYLLFASFLCGIALAVFVVYTNRSQRIHFKYVFVESRDQSQWSVNGMTFDHNITGYPVNIVPNIVHYVLFADNEIHFVHFISILSVLKNQRPEQIYIHCECNQLFGEYYKRVKTIANLTKTEVIVRQVVKPTEIFGRPLNKGWINWHSSDIMRAQVLREFGGIYLDRDVYVVQSLDVFRKYEMTLDWDENQYMGSQVLIGHKNARFLSLFLDSYHKYDPNKWYFNAGELPTTSILYKRPELIHRVKGGFGVDGPKVCPKVYRIYYKEWRKEFFTIHLTMRGNEIPFLGWCFGKDIPSVTKFDEQNIRRLDVTFGEMARDLFDFENSLLNNKNVIKV